MDVPPLSCPSAAAPGSVADHTSSRKTLAPFLGIARGVKDAVDGHRVLCILVEHRIRKAAYQPAAIVLVDDGMHLGRTADPFQTGIDAAQKFFSQAGPSPLVPGIRLCDVLLGLRRNDELSGHSGF